MKSVNIRFSNKLTYLLLGFFAFVFVAGIVYAYGSGPYPNVMGHSFGELGIPTSCTDGQTLKWSGGALVCGTDNSASLPSCSNGQFLKWNGAAWICITPITEKAKGSVVGWGYDIPESSGSYGSCVSNGESHCNGNEFPFSCNSGLTKFGTGFIINAGGKPQYYYLCIVP